MVLLDGENWEASLALANPDNDDLKLIWVGSHPPAQAWKTFAGPLQWSAVLTVLDAVYLPQLLAQPTYAGVVDVGVDFSADDTQPITLGIDGSTHDYDAVTAPMPLELTSPDDEDQLLPVSHVKRVLLVEANSDERLYWRAKLAEAGFFFVDEAATAETAQSFVAFNVYSLVIVDLDAGSPDVWLLVKHIVASRPAIDHLLITRKGLTSIEAARDGLPAPTKPLLNRCNLVKLKSCCQSSSNGYEGPAVKRHSDVTLQATSMGAVPITRRRVDSQLLDASKI